jgi:uncharacterized protein
MHEKITFAGSAIGSHWHEVGKIVKRVLGKNGIEVYVDTHTTDWRNLMSVGTGEADLGVALPHFLDQAQRREGVFADSPLKDLRVIAALSAPVWIAAAVERGSGITSLREIAERRFPWRTVMPGRDNLNGLYIDDLLAAHGMTREEIESWGGSWQPPNDPKELARAREAGQKYTMIPLTARLARAGAIDGMFVYFGNTSHWLRDLTTLLDLRFLRYDDAALNGVIARSGGQHLTLPARLFPGIDEDIAAPGWRYRLVYGTVDTPDDLVAAVLRGLEDDEVLDNAHGFSYSAFSPPQIPESLELHPVTQRYFDRVAGLAAGA